MATFNDKIFNATISSTNTDKNVPYYDANPPPLPDPIRELLEKYSHVAPSDVSKHIADIRDRAWAVQPYPCIGLFRFLSLGLTRHSAYPEVLDRLKAGQSLLDLGCCFGQELRPLVAAGVPSKNLYASDLRQEYWDLGYDLFKDRDTLESTFIAGDIFDDSEEAPLNELKGKLDIVYTGSFFHLFSWDQQFQIATKVISLLKPVKGSLVLGRHMGSSVAAPASRRDTPGATIWRHDAESWAVLWKLVGNYTDTRWEVKTEVIDFSDTEKEEGGGGSYGSGKYAEATRYAFSVTRL